MTEATEAMEKVSTLEHLPIFPLPLVLLPNEVLPLHIFEDRYRQMLVDIGPEDGMFGISLFEPDESFIDRPEIGSVGCVAEIKNVQAMPDGRSNLVALGVIRYRLLSYVDGGKPYLVGDVHYFEDEPAESGLEQLADEVFEVFERIARAAFKLSSGRGRFPEITKTDPQSFSFLATAAFNFENSLKYHLLEMTSTAERLERLREIMTKTVGQMEESAEIYSTSKTNGHSKKKLNI